MSIRMSQDVKQKKTLKSVAAKLKNYQKPKEQYNPEEGKVPLTVLLPIDWLLKHGIDTVGLFRESAVITDVKAVKADLDRRKRGKFDKCQDPHTIAGVLKLFLNELTGDTLIPLELRDVFLVSAEIPQLHVAVEKLQAAIRLMPAGNRIILALLMHLLHKVHLRGSKNKMPKENLAIIFGPSLVCIRSKDLKEAHIKTQLGIKLAEILIEYYEQIFRNVPVRKVVEQELLAVDILRESQSMRSATPQRPARRRLSSPRKNQKILVRERRQSFAEHRHSRMGSMPEAFSLGRRPTAGDLPLVRGVGSVHQRRHKSDNRPNTRRVRAASTSRMMPGTLKKSHSTGAESVKNQQKKKYALDTTILSSTRAAFTKVQNNDSARPKRIAHLFYGGGYWVMVTEVNPVTDKQILYSCVTYPNVHMQQRLRSRELIKELSYHAGRWVVISETWRDKKSMPLQTIATSGFLIQARIQETWDKGMRVNSLRYCNRRWVYISEKCVKKPPKQYLCVSKEFPRETMTTYLKEQKRIQSLVYGDGKWVLVAEESDEPFIQTFLMTRKGFPSQKISEFYADGLIIHSIFYACESWIVIAEGSRKTIDAHQQVIKQRIFPESILAKLGFS